MTSIHLDLDSTEWTPGSAYKGPSALYQGQEVFYRKVLSDRRQEGGGLAVLSKICPPPGKMVKTVAVARSRGARLQFTRWSGEQVRKADRGSRQQLHSQSNRAAA